MVRFLQLEELQEAHELFNKIELRIASHRRQTTLTDFSTETFTLIYVQFNVVSLLRNFLIGP